MMSIATLVAAGEVFMAKSMFSTKWLVHIIVQVSVAGIPSLKERPVKGHFPLDVNIAETSLEAETSPTATVLLPKM